jgi:peptide/nickel transport system permease protein
VRFVLRRAGAFLLTLWAAVTINFLLPRLMPGTPADAAIARLSRNGQLDPNARAAIESMLGVPTDSLWHQYLDYLGQLGRFDFGVSYAFYPQSVGHLVAEALPWTLLLVGSVTVIAFTFGALMGALAAWRRGTWVDSLPTVSGSTLSAFPYFWTALLLLYFLGYRTGWLPTGGAYDAAAIPNWSLEFVGDALWHSILPALTLFLTSVGGWLLGMRNTMINTLGDDYVTFAEANGLHPRTVALRYAARNALLPNLTAFGMALGIVVGGSLLVETVYRYPGLGYLLWTAVVNQDYPLMQALFLMITVSVLVANLIVDLIYGWLDPRTRR